MYIKWIKNHRSRYDINMMVLLGWPAQPRRESRPTRRQVGRHLRQHTHQEDDRPLRLRPAGAVAKRRFRGNVWKTPVMNILRLANQTACRAFLTDVRHGNRSLIEKLRSLNPPRLYGFRQSYDAQIAWKYWRTRAEQEIKERGTLLMKSGAFFI